MLDEAVRRLDERLTASPLGHRVGSVALLMTAVFFLDRWVAGATSLPAERFHEWSLTWEVVKGFAAPSASRSYLFRVGVLVGLIGLGVVRFDKLWISWEELDEGRVVRGIVFVPVLLLAWTYSTYPYNHFLGQAHLLDRGALLAFGGLALWRPVFVAPVALVAAAVIGQFDYPLEHFSTFEVMLLLKVALLFVGSLLLRAIGMRLASSALPFLTFAMLGAAYFVSGVRKLELDWIPEGGVFLLLPASYAAAWLGFLDAEWIGRATVWLSRVDWVMVAGTLVIEIGAVVLLWRRWTLLFFLCGWLVFHFLVLAISGIFFWKWLLFETALIAILVRHRSSPGLALFDRTYLLMSIVLICGGPIWFHSLPVGWRNPAGGYAYRFEGVGDSGRRYDLPRHFFAPYDVPIILTDFSGLSPEPRLPITFGGTLDPEVARGLRRARSPEDLTALEATRPLRVDAQASIERTEVFLRRFVGNANLQRSKSLWLSALAPPTAVLAYQGTDPYDGEERIARVEMTEVTYLFDGRRYVEFRTRPLLSVDIPRSDTVLTAPPWPRNPGR